MQAQSTPVWATSLGVSGVSLEIFLIAAAAADGQHRAALIRKQMGNNDMGPVLVEMEALETS